MIRSYDFESVGGIYVGKSPLGKYQEEVIHTPLQEDRTVRPTCLSKEVTILQLLHSHVTKSSMKPFTQGQI